MSFNVSAAPEVFVGRTSMPTAEWTEAPSASGSSGATVAAGLCMILVMSSAVFGNCLVIISVFRFEKLRLTTNYFIVSLALADLLVAVLVMPFSASQELAKRWVFGPLVCDIFNANDVLFSTASLLHLGCISFDRYVAVTDPFHYEERITPRRVAVLLSLLWFAATVISHIPVHLGWYTTEAASFNNGHELCVFKVNKVYCAISSSISFWIPTLVMLFTYVRIFRAARRQELLIARHSVCVDARLASDRKRRMQREHKAAKTLGVVMGCFLCCWLPFFLWYVSSTMCGDDCYTPEVLVSMLFWIGYCNSALNPLIYACLNRDFRNAFKRLLRCRQIKDYCRRTRSATYGTELQAWTARQRADEAL